ncbi:MAG: TonB-dependent receptor, partial [Bacteroidia bacterium]|nr:TonB-dependent receptor [Bacteroidia bacterium]
MKTFYSVVFTFVFTWAYAQGIRVEFQINSAFTAFPVKAAQIKVNGVNLVTDTLGSAKATIKANTACQIRVKHLAFKPYTGTIFCSKDTHIVLLLEPDVMALNEVEVFVERDNSFGISRLNNVEGTAIYAGKKSESVILEDLNANLAANNSRQLFSKVPGINVFENEGSGSSIGVGGRGLNPNRISNFNTRQNGYDISADALGYPESYYTPPSEAIERIDILRGASGLQYGTQFGGLINYRFRLAEKKPIAGNFRQTVGSFGFFNSFNQLSGTAKKWDYNTFYQYKHYTGWRERSESDNHIAFVSLGYQVNEKLKLSGEYTFMNYVAQQPGGLTDQQFKKDESTVTRNRNWFKVNWNLLSLKLDYDVSAQTRFNFTAFGLIAGRDALGYLGRPDRADDTSANRNLLRDEYKNFGAEARLLHRYRLGQNNHHFLIGLRYYNGNTQRQQGDADKTAEPNFAFLHPDNLENSAYTFPSLNYAVFAENIFQINSKWIVVPGIRLEYISTASDGYYRLINKNLAGNVLLDMKVYDQQFNDRSFLLLGLGNQYKLSKSLELYANISQNYRSINFNDMRVANPNFEVDPGLMDESGYTADGGLRGVIKNLLYFDVSVFYIQYNNRIGTTLKVDSMTYQIIRYRTNIGNSSNQGIEAFAELDWLRLFNKNSAHKLSTFINVSFINAYYKSQQSAYNGKRVEYVPNTILRSGITYMFKKFGFTVQYSQTSEQYSEATNAESSASGLYGIIPAYSILDISMHLHWKTFTLNSGLNNALNAKYFTRRTEGYPGP